MLLKSWLKADKSRSMHNNSTRGGKFRWKRPTQDEFHLGVEPLEHRLLLSVSIDYSTLLAGQGALDVAVDQDGFVYVQSAAGSTGAPHTTVVKLLPGEDCDPDTVGLQQVCWTNTALTDTSVNSGIAIHDDPSTGERFVYVTGQAFPDFPATAGAFQTESADAFRDAFVAKLDASDGTVLSATFLGGTTARDAGDAIAVDDLGFVYVVGKTGSDGTFPFPEPSGPGAGGAEVFVVKLKSDLSGPLVYSTLIGGSSGDRGHGIALTGCDEFGADCEAYVSGRTESTDFASEFFDTLTPPPVDSSHNGGEDGFVVKVNSAGNLLLSGTFLGGSGDDRSSVIDLDDASPVNVYVTGQTASANFLSGFPGSLNGFQTVLMGDTDGFVVKLNAELTTLSYSTLLGGSSNDNAKGIAVDAAGNAHVTAIPLATSSLLPPSKVA